MTIQQNPPPRFRDSFAQNSIYLLPNSFTLAALFSAFFAITQAMHGNYETAAIAVFISMLLDGMDGRIARWTNSQSAFGEQLDSLADMVSFGVAPALIAYKWQLWQFGKLGYSVAFIYCACAALRLALFNTLIGKVDKRWFIGIPSPTAAALIVGMIWVNHSYEEIAFASWFCLVITLFAGLSMVVQIPFWSFKEVNVRKKVPFYTMIMFMLVLAVVTLEPSLALFLFFLAYSLSGYVMYLWKCLKKRRNKQAV
ncbi:CDP-diacylglycerol--serine O-phosphatidyltransferase [Neisseria montereyensis]|uniref:CDP-diacylglycerol--serine O-phosphatidyltransferase n=1 Tax=Neisseria montereyensis TaxID=2973938 RepID=A0ABT2FAA4_9NEIS|nr:CDP-diacylglycerol--serine O-phosphatidyltransferase [Neisseria montereyensis]MCS4533112.1 CDP-diacylglycerol--serine O-phosphatidyltransferase [Neisseria montereyensis]